MSSFFTLDLIVFLIIGIIGVASLVIVQVTDTEIDDVVLMPITFGFLIFGFVGFIMQFLLRNLAITIGTACITWIAVTVVIVIVKKRILSEPTDYSIYEGEEAVVEIPFSGSRMGRIAATHSKTGERMEFPAKAFNSTDPTFEKGDKVYIKRISAMVAEVEKNVKWEIEKMRKGGE